MEPGWGNDEGTQLLFGEREGSYAGFAKATLGSCVYVHGQDAAVQS